MYRGRKPEVVFLASIAGIGMASLTLEGHYLSLAIGAITVANLVSGWAFALCSWGEESAGKETSPHQLEQEDTRSE